jgi:alpha/beta superfamily hydrolase
MVKIPVGDFALVGEARLVAGADAAVICHPHPAFGGHMDNSLLVGLSDALGAAGLATLRFNFRGVGGSGGMPTGGHAEHEDVYAAVAWMASQGARQIVIVGYSFGALMAARAIAEGSDVAAFAAVGFPTTLVDERPERLQHIEAALDRRLPWLFVSGDRDQFCELAQLRAWTGARPWTRLQPLPGRGHFFAGDDERAVLSLVTGFVVESLG